MKHTLTPAVLLTLGLLATPAMATEEPQFETLSQHGHIEMRRYAPFIVAETWVDGDMDAASGKGFRAIADYIFGNNVAVAPARQPGAEKIAMTAPVALEPLPQAGPDTPAPQAMQGATRWRVHFVMPSGYTLDTLPKPNNTAVQLRQVPAKTWAVLRYSGFNTEAGIQQRTDELVAWLAARHIRTVGNPQLARYNPPWTLPMLRRNEIMLETVQ